MPYAHYYPEGPGYLFVSYLGMGAQGCACLVLSVADKQLYVRKTSLNTGRSGRPDFEVLNALEHPNITRCVSTSNPPDPSATQQPIKSSVWAFKNGGTLQDLIRTHIYRLHKQIPDALVWRMLHQLLSALNHLRSHKIAHHDLVPCNIFLHWPRSDPSNSNPPPTNLPDFHLGDFGRSINLSDQSSTATPRTALLTQANDIFRLQWLLHQPLSANNPNLECSSELQSISKALLRVWENVKDVSNDADDIARRTAALEKETQVLTNGIAFFNTRHEERAAKVDLADIQRDVDEQGKLKPVTYAQLSTLERYPYKPPGPWWAVEVSGDWTSLTVVGEKAEYADKAFFTGPDGEELRKEDEEMVREASGLCFV